MAGSARLIGVPAVWGLLTPLTERTTVQVWGEVVPLIAVTVTVSPARRASKGKWTGFWVQTGPRVVATLKLVAVAVASAASCEPAVSRRGGARPVTLMSSRGLRIKLV